MNKRQLCSPNVDSTGPPLKSGDQSFSIAADLREFEINAGPVAFGQRRMEILLCTTAVSNS